MGRCGCSSCGCRYQAGPGISLSGTGSVDNPVLIGFRATLDATACTTIMSCVASNLGNGLRYAGGLLSVRLSNNDGNNLIFGTDGGLFSSGGGGGGGSSAVEGATVSSLPLIKGHGGTAGAGFAMHPEGPLDSYQVAADMSMDVVHVPVRRTREYYLIAQRYRSFGNYNADIVDNSDDTDLMMFRYFRYAPSGNPAVVKGGYFGFTYPVSPYGGTMLSDVLRTIDRRAVLYLEIRDLGAAVGEVPVPSSTLDLTRGIIQRYSLTKAVIVGIEAVTETDVPAAMTALQAAGVATALQMTTKAACDANSPASLLAAGHTWAVIHVQVQDAFPATVSAYISAGLKVMTIGQTRQYQWRAGVALGVKVQLSADPVYSAGDVSNFRYRRYFATWTWGTPDYGRQGPASASIAGNRDKLRGYVAQGVPNVLALDGDVFHPDTTASFQQTGYYILMGEQCPIRNMASPFTYMDPTNYDITVGFMWNNLVSDGSRWMGVWFGAPTDHPIREWVLSTVNTKGYEFQLTQDGEFVFQRYDGVAYNLANDPDVIHPYQFSFTWDSQWNIQPNVEYRVKISVRPNGNITLSRVDGTRAQTFNDTTWRGPYVHLGRHFFSTTDSTTCKWVRLETAVFV